MNQWRPRMIAPPMEARPVDADLNRRVSFSAFLAVFAVVWLALGYFVGKAEAKRECRRPTIERERVPATVRGVP